MWIRSSRRSALSNREAIAEHLDDLIDSLDPRHCSGIDRSPVSWWSNDALDTERRPLAPHQEGRYAGREKAMGRGSNKVLADSGDDGKAVRIANAAVANHKSRITPGRTHGE